MVSFDNIPGELSYDISHSHEKVVAPLRGPQGPLDDQVRFQNWYIWNVRMILDLAVKSDFVDIFVKL